MKNIKDMRLKTVTGKERKIEQNRWAEDNNTE